MELRPYQEDAVGKILDYAVKNPTGRLLIVVPPRGGKTLIAATGMRLMAYDQRLRGLWVAHRRELVDQAYDHLVESGIPEKTLGVLMRDDKRENASASIRVASVDTISRRSKPDAQIVVTDEAHRDASEGRRALRALYQNSFRLGITGTPYRMHGNGLREDYDEMFCVASPSELIADGYIVAPRMFVPPPELVPDVSRVRTIGGDFDVGQLDVAANKSTIVGGIVSEWKRLADDKQTLVFPVSVEHSKNIVARFREAGIAAEHLDGNVSHSKRADILARLRDGSTRVVSSCAVLSEGIDAPWIKCVVLARPTKSVALHIQQANRCMTPWKGIVPIVLDHAGNLIRPLLGAPHHDRKWTLDAPDKKDKERFRQLMKRCHSCGAAMDADAPSCTECGIKLACQVANVAPLVPDEIPGELQEARLTHDEIVAERAKLEAFAEARGFDCGWAEKVMMAKYRWLNAP